jgi:hypothetical protein
VPRCWSACQWRIAPPSRPKCGRMDGRMNIGWLNHEDLQQAQGKTTQAVAPIAVTPGALLDLLGDTPRT